MALIRSPDPTPAPRPRALPLRRPSRDAQGMDKVYLPFYRELMVGSARRDALRAKVEQLGEFACIVPCHGDIVTSNGAYVLRTHLNL